MSALILANCAILDGTHDERREDHHVLVEGDRIREVSDRPLTSQAAEMIDLGGKTLMPGLIDAHVHVVAVDAALARLAEQPLTLTSLQAAKVMEGMLQRGFTTVRDAGGADGGLAEAVAQGLIMGPRLFPSGQALSQTGGHGDLRPRTRSVVTAPAANTAPGWPASPTGSTNAAAPPATSCARAPPRSRSWRRAESPRPTIRSATCSTATRRCARSSRRRAAGIPTSSPTPIRPRRFAGRSTTGCVRSSTPT